MHGVAWALQDAGYALRGADLAFHSTVPVGSGLSSSAALEVASAVALLRLAGHEVGLTTVARLCQEHRVQGVVLFRAVQGDPSDAFFHMGQNEGHG